MKRRSRRFLSFILTATSFCSIVATSFSLSGCFSMAGDSTSSDRPIESVDEERTQLFVFNTDFGVDASWLMQAKERFEAEHALDTGWEQGKTGVQVVVRHTSRTAQEEADEILENREEVYITQQTDYRYMQRRGLLADLTATVTATMPGEARTIADKLDEEQECYFGIASESPAASKQVVDAE